MKKIRLIYAAIALASLFTVACNEDHYPFGRSESGIILTVKSPGTETKATPDGTINGVDSLNENRINAVYYYFFKDGVTDEPAVISGYFSGLDINGVGAEKTWTIPASAKTITNDLFPSGTKYCRMFVVANPPASLVSALQSKPSPTLTELRGMSLVTSLSGVQSNFVMICDKQIETSSRTEKVSVEAVADLHRLADKITLKVRTVGEYTDPELGNKWTPHLEGLTVEFHNGMNKTNLAGIFGNLTSVDDENYFVSTSDFSNSLEYTYEEIAEADIPDSYIPVDSVSSLPSAEIGAEQYVKTGDKYYCLTVSSDSETPLYTYPMTWEFADEHEPYFLFELPWQPEVGTIKSCYYKLMLSEKELASNGWYDITIDLKILGSFYKTDPVQEYLYEDYVILDWNNAFEVSENNVNAEIKTARYLVVSQNEFTLNNQQKLSIPLSTSNTCKWTVTSCSHMSFSSNTPSESGNKTTAQGWFSMNGSVLEFDHSLNNTIGTGMDYTPYIIELYVYHDDYTIPATPTQAQLDAVPYKEKITITQYPSLYLEIEEGSMPYVNGAQQHLGSGSGNPTQNRWYHVTNSAPSGTGGNSNPNMYVINVSALDNLQLIDGTYAILGDPRISTAINTGTTTASSEEITYLGERTGTYAWTPTAYAYWDYVNHKISSVAPASDPSTRKLTYYYPTDHTAKNVIAPRFRTNSAWGKTDSNALTQETATRRCATYQEEGYPAGRWRLPTNAELEFMGKLCAYGVVPPFFNNNGNYWSATNAYTYNSGSFTTYSGTNNIYCRCVYDEWYWDIIDQAEGNTHSTKNVFYWGDKER